MKYIVEQRGLFFVAVDREAGVELAPWFECEGTAVEIARRTEAPEPQSQFMSGIPCVPVDSPIPRTPDVLTVHPVAARERIAKGMRGAAIFARHKLNPTR